MDESFVSEEDDDDSEYSSSDEDVEDSSELMLILKKPTRLPPSMPSSSSAEVIFVSDGKHLKTDMETLYGYSIDNQLRLRFEFSNPLVSESLKMFIKHNCKSDSFLDTFSNHPCLLSLQQKVSANDTQYSINTPPRGLCGLLTANQLEIRHHQLTTEDNVISMTPCPFENVATIETQNKLADYIQTKLKEFSAKELSKNPTEDTKINMKFITDALTWARKHTSKTGHFSKDLGWPRSNFIFSWLDPIPISFWNSLSEDGWATLEECSGFKNTLLFTFQELFQVVNVGKNSFTHTSSHFYLREIVEAEVMENRLMESLQSLINEVIKLP